MGATYLPIEEEMLTRPQYYENAQEQKSRTHNEEVTKCIYHTDSLITSLLIDSLLICIRSSSSSSELTLRIVLKAFPTTLVSSLYSLTGIPPFPYRRRLLAADFYIHATSKLPQLPQYVNLLLSHDLNTSPYSSNYPPISNFRTYSSWITSCETLYPPHPVDPQTTTVKLLPRNNSAQRI